MPVPIISLFTGGGFLDMGFEEAGFHIVWTNEVNVDYADMYEYAVSSWRISKGRNRHPAKVSCRENVESLTASHIKREALKGNPADFFGIIGGPPCTDFSIGGKNGGEEGVFGKLSQVFANLVCQIRPCFFVMENVPGLCQTKKHQSFFHKLITQFTENGYLVDSNILSALELGVPQDRDRLFVVGIKRSAGRIILGKEFHHKDKNWFLWPKAIYPGAKELPWPGKVQNGEIPLRPHAIPASLTVFPYLVGPPSPERVPNGDEYFTPYSSRFQTQKEGDVSAKSFKRLHRFRYSPTAWYGNNEVHLHPWKPRRLSVREALRIQSVPDEYILPSNKSLSAKYRMICNGVPFLVAKQLAESLLHFLRPIM